MITRKDAMQALLKGADDRTAVIASLGSVSYFLFETGDRPLNLYTFGGMGQAVAIGLGLAVAMPDIRVVVADGDGSALMNLGVLSVAGREKAKNLLHVVFDDGAYESTGGQPTATAEGTSLSGIAMASGFRWACRVTTPAELHISLARWKEEGGPSQIDIACDSVRGEARPLFDPVFYKYRFASALAALR